MSEIKEIYEGYLEGLRIAEEILSEERDDFDSSENHFFEQENIDDCANRLALGDNLEYMKWLLDNGYKDKLKLIYIDPPFFTKTKYNATISVKDFRGKTHKIHHLAYDDTFESILKVYIENITSRLVMLKDLLADDGTIWVHLDWHSSHYVKIVMDEVFGENNFVNEVVWKYKSGGSSHRHFSKKHDIILVYSKTKDYYLNVPKEKSYNRNLKPYCFKGVKEYQDEYGWYTLVNMKDVWSIDMVGRTSKERNGYATQKPLELLDRIVLAATEQGDWCGDFFCGSGSLIEAAQRNNRKWIGCDKEELAVSMTMKRIDKINSDYLFQVNDDSDKRTGRVALKVNNRDSLESGKGLYSCEISKFVPDIDFRHIPIKERILVKDLIKEEPMQFIDSILIDTDYNGCFKDEIVIEDEFDNIRFISRGEFACRVLDIFGREYCADIIQKESI